MATGLGRSCPVCFAPKGEKCNRPTDTGRAVVDWLHHKREEPTPEPVRHDGVLYGIGHPGPRLGCGHCMSTVVQAENMGIELMVKPQVEP